MVFLFMVRQHDIYLKYFVTTGTLLATIVGAAYSVDVEDFVFGYLFVGLNVSLVLSMLYHGFGTRQSRNVKVDLGVFGDEKTGSV